MKNKTINQKIAKYIYNLFKIKVNIKVQSYFKNDAGAKAYLNNVIIFSLKYLKQDSFPKYLIWHEVGHLKTSKSNNLCVENEVNAQLWALNEAERRGYNNLWNDFYQYVQSWGTDSYSSTNIVYAIAKHKIIRKILNNE
jgi:hypothetical protein